ncbi:hypothetical protein N7451_006729 [Penicillium sp. IBT 35674x]|nr:hypothetical protein N7451_006729 [Penicillium sp. IBT 35674x]
MDDDYVAEILAKEARDSSQKYSTEGLGAYVPRKPASNAPKPNTRFLRHLIKETDNHNTALKRKEEREARERMRQLKKQSAAASESTARSSRGQDPSRVRDSARPRREDREERRRRRSRSASTDRDRSRRRRRDEDRDKSRETDRDRTERRRERHRHHSSRKERRDRGNSYSRSRSRSPRKERTSRSHRSEQSRRSESPRRRSSHSHRTPRERERRSRDYDDTSSRQHRLSPPEPSVKRKRESPSSQNLRPTESDDSDPLEDLVGPLPAKEAPIRSRGRGAYKVNSSNIDSHFASDYDPTLDIQPDDDHVGTTIQSSRRPVSGLMTGDDDWDTAMEALRDRARWRQKGEERLRAAGIGEETIDRWKTESASTGATGERQPEDVRWSKKGEGREWDRGKFVNDDGHIDVRAAWS